MPEKTTECGDKAPVGRKKDLCPITWPGLCSKGKGKTGRTHKCKEQPSHFGFHICECGDVQDTAPGRPGFQRSSS
jgi:hypothetical protein